MRQYQGRLPKHTLPIAIDEFDNLFLVSLARGTTGRILFWDHESEGTDASLALIAHGIKQFLGMLEPDKVSVFEIATITFRGGEVSRRVLPQRIFSLDRDSVVAVDELRAGERVLEFGKRRIVADVKMTSERH